MNFDKESKSEDFFFWGGGGGRGVGWRGRVRHGGGREGGFQTKKTSKQQYVFTYFCAYALVFSNFNTNKRSNGQERGITLPTFYRIQSKVI